MSFLTSGDGILTMNLWPLAEKDRLLKIASPTRSWEIFPTNIESMVEWAEVIKDTNVRSKYRNKIVVYKELSNGVGNIVYPVSVRLNGYIRNIDVGRLGDWDGKPENVHAASQTISLESNGCAEAWNSTLECLNLMAYFMSRTMNIPLEREKPFFRNLVLQRKVFYRSKREEAVTVPRSDDPNGLLQFLPNEWDLNEDLPIGQQLNDGSIKRYNRILLSTGDFVEVCASFDIVISRQSTFPRTSLKLFLCMSQILSIIRAPLSLEMKDSRGIKRNAGDAMIDAAPVIKKRPNEMVFSKTGHVVE
ncbi:hypothetical protein BJ138DRAFT_1117661 [Hygrophoropsis aurantiaca]|uniref:Uncharacterized protein n=1 Tax=Hygrophoropsis aurantiaca TaxID=72124 RepID=A0ACB7ZZP0_9AGAM|nr:hypothetical protein BJ138DRAFT_1117661 [Hygrophoropsis aurantiaca]